LKGYAGKILNINLSNGSVKTLSLGQEIYNKVLGGAGLAAYLMLEKVKNVKDPLDESNVLIFAVGPLTHDEIPTSGRVTIASISPLTNGWGETHVGTRFAMEFKKVGYDAVVVEGKAEKPVYIYIRDGVAEVKDASKYWGLGIHETVTAIKKDLNDPQTKVLAIGPAGEKLVRFSIIANEEGIGGRCGLGAVMGFKNLKAIAVRGSTPVEVAYPEELKKYARELMVKLYKGGARLRTNGTGGAVSRYYLEGNLPIMNFRRFRWDEENVKKISGETITAKYLKNPYACNLCPIMCKRWVKVDNGKYFKGRFEGLGPEYETLAMLGSNLLIDDLEAIIKANYLCDNLGLDTISTGNVIGFIFEAAEKGLIDKNMDGLNLTWSNADTMLKLIEKIAYRDGIGDLLAEGVKRVSEKLGGKEFAVHVKGTEAPAHDPRAYFAQGLSYGTINRGADHLGWPHTIYRGSSVPEFGLEPRKNRYDDSDEMPQVVVKMQNLMIVYDSLVLCKYAFSAGLTVTDITKLLYFTTGKEYTSLDILEIGNRIWKLQRRINNERGIKTNDDVLPPRLFQPYEDKPAEIPAPMTEKRYKELLTIYYRLRGISEDGVVQNIDV